MSAAGATAVAGKHRLRRATPVATVALGVVFIVMLAVLSGLLVWQNYRSTLSAAEEKAQLSAHVVAAHVQWLATAADQSLFRIDTAIGSIPDLADSGNVTAVSGLPAGLHYAVYGATGGLLVTDAASSEGVSLATVSVADRNFFKAAKAGSGQTISRLLDDPVTGDKVFLVMRPIMRDGQFVGLAAISVPQLTVVKFWASLGLGMQSTASIIRSDGWIVARYPQLDQSINVSQAPVFSGSAAQQRQGYYQSAASPADGVARIVGFWRVEGFPLVAVASISRKYALAPFWAGLRVRALVAVPVLLALLLAIIWIARLQARDQRVHRELEAAAERNEALFREIHHRVKNNLQAVSSLVQLQPISQELRTAMSARIAAMVGVHEHLYQTNQFEHVQLDDYIGRLLADLERTYASRARIVAHLAPVRVGRDQAMPVGLIVNEVVANALKYAFPDGRDGTVTVTLEAREGNMVRLDIADDGIGYQPDKAAPGMGSRLIEGFCGQVGGEKSVTIDGGTRFTLVFPRRDPARR